MTDGRKEMEQFVYRKIGHSIERPSYFFFDFWPLLGCSHYLRVYGSLNGDSVQIQQTL